MCSDTHIHIHTTCVTLKNSPTKCDSTHTICILQTHTHSHIQTHPKTHTHIHTPSIYHFPLNHFFHCFLACAAHTHHLPVIQLYSSPHSSTSALSSPSAAQSAVIYVTTLHRPVRRPDMWHYRQLQPWRMSARHEREGELTCFFFLTQKHFCFHFSHQPVKFPLPVFQQQTICLETLT